MASGKNYKVILCHESEQDELAKRLSFLLQLNGIQSTALPTDIPAEEELSDDVSQTIQNSKILITLLSEKTMQSASVLHVLEFAHKEEKIIRPLLLEKFKVSKEFSACLPKKEQFDASKNLDETLRNLLTDVCGLLSIPGTVLMDTVTKKDPEPEEAPKDEKDDEKKDENAESDKEPKKKKKWVLPVILASVALVAAGIVFGYFFSHPVICGVRRSTGDTILSIQSTTVSEKDIAGIGKMKKLLTLSITDCTITGSDLSPLVTSDVLETLMIENCSLTDAQSKSLRLDGKKVRTLSLKNCKGFTSFDSLSALQGSLEKLYLSDSEIQTLPDFSAFSKLNTLDISGIAVDSGSLRVGAVETLLVNRCGLKSLSFLADCSEIRELQASNNKLKSLKGLEKNIWIGTLVASDNKIENIDALSNATQLRSVNLGKNALKNGNLEVLKKSVGTLSELVLDDNHLTDSSFLSDLPQLSSVSFSRNTMETLFIFKCPSLKLLAAEDCNISSINWAKADCKLTSLNLSGNKLSTISDIPMEDQIAVSLDLSRNALSSDDFLVADHLYKDLVLYGNHIDKFTTLYSVHADTMAFDYTPSFRPEDIQGNNYNIQVVNCPLDQQAAVKTILSFRVTFADAKPGQKIAPVAE